MKAYNHFKVLIFIFAILSFSGCSNNDYLLSEDGKNVSITFRTTLASELNTRAIGNAESINSLTVAVYEVSETLPEKLTKRLTITEDWDRDINQRKEITLSLIKERRYKILFWAANKYNNAYTLTDDGQISVCYNNYTHGGFAEMEKMDAFCHAVEGKINEIQNQEIKLTRPFAQLNFADKTTQPVQGTHKAVVTFHSIPTSFNPFTGEVTMTENENETDDIIFTFEDFPTDETLSVEGSTYYYLSSNYLFAPTDGTTTVSATIELQQTDGSTINKFEFKEEKAITLKKNMKTNVYGNIVSQPETWSVWDGETITAPTTDEQNRYVIDEASDIAWLAVNGVTLTDNTTFLQTKDIDMDGKTIASIKLPVGSTYDGGGKTIKNFANSLFGDATTLTVKDLTIENITASGATHIGTLVNTLKGSSSFTNVSVTNASATTTSGAAGGMVGYIDRTTEKNRNETLNVSFNGCKLDGISISGSASEGKFVGLLCGYDNNESLSFDSACEATNVTVADYTSSYTKANNSAWCGEIDEKYDGWLGAETYRRAKVSFDGIRLAPRWDGKTATAKADLLLYEGESNQYEVYSPFDLAGVSNATASPTALYLMENVDMYGQGVDGKYNVPSTWTQSACESEDDNYFKSFSTITYLEGNNNGIYNLNINTKKVLTSLYYGGFIQSTSGTTTHKNIKFYNSCVVVPLVVYKNEDKGSAGMLVSNIAGDSYTMDNVHTHGCKIFALQKVGGIAARVAATNSLIKNCSVNDGYIENYECKQNPETFSGGNDLASVSTTFYSYGEVGGMFGFVEKNTTIDECKVNRTTIYAFGQDDKAATKSGLAFILTKYYTVPGRHVGTFIGDIRTTTSGGGTITMTNIFVDSNTKCTKRWDKHNNKCETVGRAYFLYFKDDEGTVKYNETKLKLQNCQNNQNRNQ